MRRFAIGLALSLGFSAAGAPAEKKIITPEGMELDLPFSSGVLAGIGTPLRYAYGLHLFFVALSAMRFASQSRGTGSAPRANSDGRARRER